MASAYLELAIRQANNLSSYSNQMPDGAEQQLHALYDTLQRMKSGTSEPTPTSDPFAAMTKNILLNIGDLNGISLAEALFRLNVTKILLKNLLAGMEQPK